MKQYNTFSRLHSFMMYDGSIETMAEKFKYSEGMHQPDFEPILRYLKATIKCDRDNGLNCNRYKAYEYLTGGQNGLNIIRGSGHVIYGLPDGADFNFVNIYHCEGGNNPDRLCFWAINFAVDTNGIEKGPNALGRDLFEFIFYPNKKEIMLGHEAYATSTSRVEELQEDKILEYCDSTKKDEKQGDTCGLRLLFEKKMDY